jgi:hypothetical protein
MVNRPVSLFAPRRLFPSGLAACVAAILFVSACDPGNSVQPTVPPKDTTVVPVVPAGKPYLVHTGVNLSAYPGEALTESLYVANAAPGTWRVSLISAPPGTYLSGNLITYRLPEGLTGAQSVHALASKDTSFIESTWTLTANPVANRTPSIEPVAMPTWIIAGKTFRTVIRANDPDGDPIQFSLGGSSKPGVVLHDSILEWTPTADQAGPAPIYAQINVSDNHGHINFITIGVTVLAFDPQVYAAALKPGRVWWIKGYSKTWSIGDSSKSDSTYMRRSVTILTADSASGSFAFRVQDTLSGTRSGILDSTYTAVRREGSNLEVPVIPGLIPFGWPGNADAATTTQFPIGGKSFTARREVMANTCLGGGGPAEGTKFGCGGGEKIYAAGWGLVSLQSESSVPFVAQSSRQEYVVWDVAEP